MRLNLVLALVVFCLLPGCSLILPTSDDLAGGEDENGENRCPGSAGPKMVDVGTYCIDATEVTAQQYAAFLSAGVATNGNPDPGCAVNNTSYEPSTWPNGSIDDRPVVFIDFCDAVGFCAFAGKRLCGGEGGAPVEAEGYTADAAHDEWYGACRNGGTTEFPYGDAQVADACNQNADALVVPVKSYPGCRGQGVYAEVFDLGGNAGEWVNVCHNDYCRVYGGVTGESTGDCATDDSLHQEKLTREATLGFRCCANSPP